MSDCLLFDCIRYPQVVVIIPGGLSSSLIDTKSNYITIGTVPLMSQEQLHQPVTAMPQPIQATAPGIMEMPPELATELNAPPPYDPGSCKYCQCITLEVRPLSL